MALITSAEVLAYMNSSTATATAGEQALVDIVTPQAINAVKEEVGFEVEFGTFTEYHPAINVAPIEDELIEGYEVVGGRVVPRGPRGQKARAIMQLRQLPVREIVSVYEAPAAWDSYPPDWPAATLLVEGHHYRVDYEAESRPGVDATYIRMSMTGHLIRRVGIWSPVGRSTRVIFKAGYTADELAGRFSAFRLAALMTAAFLVREAKLGGMKPGPTGILVSRTVGSFSESWMPPPKSPYGLGFTMPPAAKKLLEPFRRMSQYID